MEGGCCTPDLLDEAGAPRALRASLASLSRSSGKTRLSERRYTTESADLETVEEGNRSEDFESKEKEFSLSKIVKPTPPRPKEKPPSILRLPVLRPAENKGHHRTRSHHRQKSIYFSAETSYDQMMEELQEKENIDPIPSSKRSTPTSSHCSPLSTQRIPKKVHTRTISDADSVVYTGPADEVPPHLLQDSLEVQPIKPLQVRQSNNSTVHNSGQDEDPNLSGFLTAAIESFQPASRTLPILGTLPCSAYCQKCMLDVHTMISFDLTQTSKVSSALLSLLGPVLSCCEVPIWLNKMKVHKCSLCRSTIATSA